METLFISGYLKICQLLIKKKKPRVTHEFHFAMKTITNHHCYFTTWFFVEIPGSKTSLLSLLCEILSTYIIFNLWKTSLFVDFCNKTIYFSVSFFALFKLEAKWLIFRNNRNTKSFWSHMICTELTEDSLHSWLNGCRIFFKALI